MDFQIGFNEVEIDALENESVEAVWTYYNVQENQHHIVPDGRADLIFTFDVQVGGELSNIIPLISPPFTKAHFIRVDAHQGFIGLRLRAGSAGAFLKTPLSKISGSLQYGKYAVEHIPWLENLCSDKNNISQLITDINQHVCATSSQVKSSMVSDILSLIHEAQGIMQINNIAHQVKVSERTLNRKFTNAVGLSPKQFSSIVRLRRAIDCLTNPCYAISSIAMDCGFSDQAHMTREIKNHMGLTPSLLQKKLNTEILL
ncbi:helix-turn-helix domain-containing protein [Photobacterium lipolyticum]|uniref:AraC family transcriptional regulator n=1 Tax=Photobacterium lipolyticum TaxID=266810 RepID=A0A2T3MV36_9GAMM|nr:helix-turn-helix domain-containing protein [Photobacterium lipolyticum]PSW03798.1 AraC family transcriptional regulator [Photobacterium lipolyticum]